MVKVQKKNTDDLNGDEYEYVEGDLEEFEILELSEDVYATAYLLAKNAGAMYSLWPHKNTQIW